MAGSPRVVNETTEFGWDHVTHRLTKGQVIDVPPGSALEDAIGAHRLDPLPPLPASAAEPAAEDGRDDGSPAGTRRARAKGAGGEKGDGDA